jgi:L-fuculose-phosphate aldolase
METLEHFAKIALIARLVGQPKELSPEAIGKLLDVRERAGYMTPDARGGQVCGYLPGRENATPMAVQAQSNGDETVTLTKSELSALITEAARLIAQQMRG